MSKAIVLVLALVACTFAFPALEKINNIVSQDQCGIHGMETIKPRLQNKIEELRVNPDNAEAKAELLAMIEDVTEVYDSCGIQNKIDTVLGDPIENAGVAFLLASNCFKDVGILLLIADSIVEDPSNITNDVIVAIFGYIIGKQTVGDCEQFLHFIL